ncbi:MAG: M48 family metalloprotease [Bacteroidota bacterium]|nr:M48 family metalloprotease [Bacteroidota bacterium]
MISISSCNKLTELVPVDVDLMIGKQFSNQMEVMPAMGGTILPEKGNEEAYKYLNNIKNKLLNSKSIKYKDAFPYELRIIKEDSVLNAFCVAGGYIYVYTGIIKFLDNEAELAGVMAHEIAHAELRHTTIRLVSEYGLSVIISLAIGADPGILVNIGKELLGLSFSRGDESDADARAVAYMYDTDYDPRAVGGFFKKVLLRNKDAKVPEFLSTHPASDNRVSHIEEEWAKLGGKQGELYQIKYAKLKELLK